MRAEDRPKAAESGRMLMYKQKHFLKKSRRQLRAMNSKHYRKFNRMLSLFGKKCVILLEVSRGNVAASMEGK